MTAAPILEAQNVDVVLGKHKILEDVSFEIAAGEYIGIVGPNGGGKTTLLRAMLGLIPLSKGEIFVSGKKTQNRVARRIIGYVPQHFTTSIFNFAMTVKEVVATGRINVHSFGPLRREDHLAIEEALDMVSVQNLKNRMFADLSGGQRQRVVIARAMAGRPKILFLDEPLSAVDLPAQKNFYKLLTEMNEREKLTVIMVTHDLEMVAAQTRRVLCINRKLHASCHPSELLTSSVWDETFGEEHKPIHHQKHGP